MTTWEDMEIIMQIMNLVHVGDAVSFFENSEKVHYLRSEQALSCEDFEKNCSQKQRKRSMR